MFSDIFRRVNTHLTEHELRTRKLKQRRIALIAGSVLVLLGLGYFSARPVLNAVRGWQARRHADKAFALIESGKWSDARDEATAAYQLRNTEPQAIRAVARLLSRAGQTDALGFWSELRKRATLTRSDLRDEANIALIARDWDRAEVAIEQLLQSGDGGPQPGDWLLAARSAGQKQQFDRATEYVNKVFTSSSATDREQLQATVALDSISRAQGETDNAIVARHLTALVHRTNDVALDALVALSELALLSNAPSTDFAGMSTDDIIQALETHPLATTQHKLLVINLKIHQHPEQRETLLRDAVAGFKGANNNTLAIAATWLNTLGEYQRELDLVPQDRALQTPQLFAQYVDALGALGRWDEIRKLIESEKFPLDPVMEHMYLARCYAQQNQTNGAENNWQRAIAAAAGDVNKLMMLAEYAEKNGSQDVAGAAFDAAAVIAPKSRAVQLGRLRIAYATHDTKKIHGMLVDLLKLWPGDTSIQNDEAYTHTLLLPPDPDSAELKTIESTAEKLIAHEPSSLPHRTLLALARLRQNRAADAMAVYNNVRVTASALTPSAQAVHVAVFQANGKMADAKKEAASIKRDQLLPEERALITN